MHTSLAIPSVVNSSTDSLSGIIHSGICAMEFEALDQKYSLHTRLEGVRIGAIDILRYEGRGLQKGDRRLEHIREDHADHYLISIPQQAKFGISQNRIDYELSPGAFTLVATAKPFRAMIRGTNDRDMFSAIEVRIPGSLLRHRVPYIDDFCNKAIEIGPGASHLMRSMIELSLLDGPYLCESQNVEFGAALLDVIVGAAIHAPEAKELYASSMKTRREHVLSLAKIFIDANLSNPALESRHIAEHCGVSVRSLQLAFAASASTVASYVRELRLQYCCEALKNPKLCNRTITEISSDWGFSDASQFSRAYRYRYGKAPSHERIK